MVEGQPPFGTDKNPIALLHKVARGGYAAPKHAGPLAPLLRKMLASQPKRRPTMASVADALDSLHRESAAAREVSVGLVALGFDAATVGGTGHSDAAPVAQDAATPPPITHDSATSSTIALEDAGVEEPDPGSPTPPTTPRRSPGLGQCRRPFLRCPQTLVDRSAADREDRPRRSADPARGSDGRDGAARLAAAAAAGAAVGAIGRVPSWTTDAPPAEPPRVPRRRQRGRIAGALILLGALGIGAVLLFSLLWPDVGSEADPTPEPTSVSTPVEETSPAEETP